MQAGRIVRRLSILPTALLVSTALAAADLSGVWELRWEPDFGGNVDAYECTFRQDARRLTVTCRDDPAFTGDVDGRKVTLSFKTGRDGTETATLTGELDERGTTITGTWHLSEQKREGKFVARRKSAE